MRAYVFPLRLPVVRVSQQLGEFFAVAISARILRQIVFLDPTRISSVDQRQFLYRLLGSQREASITRARSIAKYINSVESAFPNSVILSANYNDQGTLSDDLDLRWRIETDDCGDHLVIPSGKPMASVIDGQHRLLGFDHAKDERKDMELLCSVYLDLPVAYQAYLFATINMNQRKVDKSLAYEQFGYNLDEEGAESWAPDKLAVFFTRRLNLDPDSPLFQHIKIAPLDADLIFTETERPSWKISTACIVEGLLSLFSSKPRTDRDLLHGYPLTKRRRNLLPQDNSPLRSLYLTCQDEVLWIIVTSFLKDADTFLWQKANPNSYIRKTIGVQALFDVFRTIAQKTEPSQLQAKLTEVLKAAAIIDFSDQFFQASGKGRVRVKNAILHSASELKSGDVSAEDFGFYQRLLLIEPERA